MSKFTESDVEEAALAWLKELGWTVAYGVEASPDGAHPVRLSNGDVILESRLVAAIERLNPSIPAEARSDALRKVMAVEMPSLVEENRRLHRLIVEGVPVGPTYRRAPTANSALPSQAGSTGSATSSSASSTASSTSEALPPATINAPKTTSPPSN